MAEQSGSPKVYLVSDEQLQSLKAARNPEIASTVSQVEKQHIGNLPAYLQKKAGEAKGAISEQARAAYEQAAKQVEEAKAAGQARVEEARGGQQTHE